MRAVVKPHTSRACGQRVAGSKQEFVCCVTAQPSPLSCELLSVLLPDPMHSGNRCGTSPACCDGIVQVSPVRSRPGQSPMTSPRTSTFKLSPNQPFPRTSAGTASPRTPAARTSPRGGLAARTKSPARCHSEDSAQQQAQQQQQTQQQVQQPRRADPGYAAHHASRIATQDPLDSSIPQQHVGSFTSLGSQQKPAGAAGTAAAPSNSSNGNNSSGSRQMLTKQVALLVSEYLAKQRLKVLHSKQEAVQARRDVLLATKAQLELKKLRRWRGVFALCKGGM